MTASGVLSHVFLTVNENSGPYLIPDKAYATFVCVVQSLLTSAFSYAKVVPLIERCEQQDWPGRKVYLTECVWVFNKRSVSQSAEYDLLVTKHPLAPGTFQCCTRHTGRLNDNLPSVQNLKVYRSK